MTADKICDIEKNLSFALSAFQESPNIYKTKKYISDYTIKYCMDNNLEIDETLAIVNTTLPKAKQVKREQVVPNSQREKKFCIKTTLFDLISDNCALFSNEEKRQELIANFCKLTGMDLNFVTPIIQSRIQAEKRTLIETVLYDVIIKNSNKSTTKNFRQEIKDIVLEFSEAIDTTPEYTLGVLTRKIKSEKQKKLSDSNDSNDAR